MARPWYSQPCAVQHIADVGSPFGRQPDARHLGGEVSASSLACRAMRRPSACAPQAPSLAFCGPTSVSVSETSRGNMFPASAEPWVGGRTRGEGRGVDPQGSRRKCSSMDPSSATGSSRRTAPKGLPGLCRASQARRSTRSELSTGFVAVRLRQSVEALRTLTCSSLHDWREYASIAKRGYEHFAVAECGDPEVAEDYLPIIHLVFANLKTWLIGIHHGVSHQHLQAYLNEFTFRFNRRFYPFNAFRSLLGIAGDVSAPTFDELYSGEWEHPTCCG